jgi:hypothetical protein
MCALASQVWANDYVNFLAKQQVGQDMTVTGGFRRSFEKRHFFRRDDKTGEVENFDFFIVALTPTTLIGNGSLSLQANVMNFLLVLSPDENLLKNLPERGDNLWFTGMLLGFQHGTSGIITSPFSGGGPYLLLKRVATVAPLESPQERQIPSSPTP